MKGNYHYSIGTLGGRLKLSRYSEAARIFGEPFVRRAKRLAEKKGAASLFRDFGQAKYELRVTYYSPKI